MHWYYIIYYFYLDNNIIFRRSRVACPFWKRTKHAESCWNNHIVIIKRSPVCRQGSNIIILFIIKSLWYRLPSKHTYRNRVTGTPRRYTYITQALFIHIIYRGRLIIYVYCRSHTVYSSSVHLLSFPCQGNDDEVISLFFYITIFIIYCPICTCSIQMHFI